MFNLLGTKLPPPQELPRLSESPNAWGSMKENVNLFQQEVPKGLHLKVTIVLQAKGFLLSALGDAKSDVF